jgi:GT2 family glycosyltransferase
MNPLVTVVIPTHNRSFFLRSALRSVLGQREVDVQIIVVDDASTDDTADVVGSFGASQIHLVRHPAPLGVSTARNHGIEIARGEWVAFLDDDDLWAPEKLASQVAAMRSDGRAWAYAGSVTVSKRLEIIAGRTVPAAAETVAGLPWRNPVPAGASNVIVRRDLLSATGNFDETLIHLADWDLWIRLGQSGLPSAVDAPLVAYRMHTANASGHPDTLLKELNTIEQRYQALRQGKPVDRASILRWAAWNYLRAGKQWDALRAYASAVAAGDLRSIGRAIVAFFDPGIAERGLKRHAPDAEWAERAEPWLRAIALQEAA